MNKPSIISRNVALLLKHDQPTEDRFIGWSATIGEQITSDIQLNRQNMWAHVSLYNIRLPLKNLPEMERRLASVRQELPPVELHFNETSRVLEYVFVDAVVSDALREMHERLIAALNDVREGEIHPGALDAAGNNERLRSNILETGMMLSRADFQPHVTVAHTQTAGEAEAARAMLPQRLGIRTLVPSLHLVVTGAFGTCKEIVKEFRLSGHQ